MSTLRNYVGSLGEGQDIGAADAESFFDQLIASTDEDLLAELFHAWDRKGISEDDIFHIARIMRERCTKIRAEHDTVIDIVGTGGSSGKTFNVSTAAAFVVAGAGVPVAKHGNRAATSSTGSADVLGALGIKPDIEPADAERCLRDFGICFMFAPKFHRLSPTLAKVRRGLGFPTIFNCVGPLCNPAGVPFQLIGVWDSRLVTVIARGLCRLGTRRSWVVHGEGGLDEISGASTTFVAEASAEDVATFELFENGDGVSPGGFIARSPDESAKIIRGVLSGELAGSFAEELVVINAAAGLVIAGRSYDLAEGRSLAIESIRRGDALQKLKSLMEAFPV